MKTKTSPQKTNYSALIFVLQNKQKRLVRKPTFHFLLCVDVKAQIYSLTVVKSLIKIKNSVSPSEKGQFVAALFFISITLT